MRYRVGDRVEVLSDRAWYAGTVTQATTTLVVVRFDVPRDHGKVNSGIYTHSSSELRALRRFDG